MDDVNNSQDVEIRDYLNAIRQRMWLIILLGIVMALVMYLWLSSQDPLYETNSRLLVVGGAAEAVDAQLTDIQVGERLALSYVERLSNREVLEETIQDLDLDITVEELRERLDIAPVGRTQLINLAVRDEDPQTARDLANTIPGVFSKRNALQQIERFSDSRERLEAELSEMSLEINDLTTNLSQLMSDPETSQVEIALANDNLIRFRETYTRLLRSYDDLRVVEVSQQSNIIVDEAAVTPMDPVWPSVLLNTVLAGILGVLLGIVLIVIKEFFDNSVKTPEDVLKTVGLPTLAGIASYPVKRGDSYELVAATQPRSHVSEAFRGLRTAILYANVDRAAKSLLITSANPSEGKSITTANLGIVMAQTGNRVLIIDADLRKPVQHKIFGLVSNNSGLTNVLLSMVIEESNLENDQHSFDLLEGVIHETRQRDLYLLASGSLPPNPAELVGSEKMERLIHLLSNNFDMVLVDSPPMLAVTDAAVMSTRVDDVILVCRSGETRSNQLQQAVYRLREVNATLIGVVLNRVAAKTGGYYPYSDKYHRDDTHTAVDEVVAMN